MPTPGSRRYLCMEISRDSIICNDRSIDYSQLYAQVMYEVRERGMNVKKGRLLHVAA